MHFSEKMELLLISSFESLLFLKKLLDYLYAHQIKMSHTFHVVNMKLN